MGFPSYLEDIIEKRSDNLFMRGRLGIPDFGARRPAAKSSPPRPANANFNAPQLMRCSETISERTQTIREKHILAILELMPGKNRHH